MRHVRSTKSERVKTRFLLFPRTIGFETRWLERATWREVYDLRGGYPSEAYWAWSGVEWLDKGEL